MSDKFSLYQTDGLWGIIENTFNEKQTSIKSYFGSDLIIKRLNEQAEQIDQLKQQLAEKDKEINSLIIDYEKRISQEQELMSNLEKQLAEKEEELLKQKEKSARTEQIYNGIIVDKDKEIEKLKQQYTILENENGKLTTELIMDKYKKAQKEVSFGMQLAIQELEKVKEEMDLNGNSYCEIRQGTSPHNPTDYAWFNYVKFRNYLNQQIKELKGE